MEVRVTMKMSVIFSGLYELCCSVSSDIRLHSICNINPLPMSRFYSSCCSVVVSIGSAWYPSVNQPIVCFVNMHCTAIVHNNKSLLSIVLIGFLHGFRVGNVRELGKFLVQIFIPKTSDFPLIRFLTVSCIDRLYNIYYEPGAGAKTNQTLRHKNRRVQNQIKSNKIKQKMYRNLPMCSIPLHVNNKRNVELSLDVLYMNDRQTHHPRSNRKKNTRILT